MSDILEIGEIPESLDSDTLLAIHKRYIYSNDIDSYSTEDFYYSFIVRQETYYLNLWCVYETFCMKRRIDILYTEEIVPLNFRNTYSYSKPYNDFSSPIDVKKVVSSKEPEIVSLYMHDSYGLLSKSI